MSPQIQLGSTYSTEYGLPTRGRPARPRPTSTHRRNNPHPRPDFLLPRKLQTAYGSRQVVQMIAPPPPLNPPLLPPVRHISVQCPDGKAVQSQLVFRVPEKDSGRKLSVLPPSGPNPKARITGLSINPSLKNLQSTADPSKALKQRLQLCGVHGICGDSTQAHRRHSGADPQRELPRKHTHIAPSGRGCRPTHSRRACSSSAPDPSGGHSCFHVVKSFHAGHYTIHPEFVSECLR